MTLNLTYTPQMHTDFSPRITVIGVGGGGTNAVNTMINLNLKGVEFVVANTDAQSLQNSRADRRIQLGPHLTLGLGAGAKPEIGRAAAEEAADEVDRHLDGVHMVFITAGMGGGTGTGAAPVIARMARQRGILTVGVVTKPFTFEGGRRAKAADLGIEELQQWVDTLIVIPNQNLFRLSNERTSFKEAFQMADKVLYMGVRGVTDLMVAPGLVNLDFADIRTVMLEMGKAMMGTGEADGEDRALRAAELAINNPLLEDTSMSGARGLLINITGGGDMTLFEVDQAANRIRAEVDEDANIIFGTAIDDSLNGIIRVSVVATGIETQAAERPQLAAVGGIGANAGHPTHSGPVARDSSASAAQLAMTAAQAPVLAQAVGQSHMPQQPQTVAGQNAVGLSGAAMPAQAAPPPSPSLPRQFISGLSVAGQPATEQRSSPSARPLGAQAMPMSRFAEPRLPEQRQPEARAAQPRQAEPMLPADDVDEAPVARHIPAHLQQPLKPMPQPSQAPQRSTSRAPDVKPAGRASLFGDPAASPSPRKNLFSIVTGAIRGTNHEPAPAPEQMAQRAEPHVAAFNAEPRPQVQQASTDEMGIEIPAFLRRQT